MRWHRVSDPRVMRLKEGAVLRVLVRDQGVCFVKLKGTLHALEDKCPHQGKSFEGGTCEGGYLVCPWHKMSFDPVTGSNRYGMTSNAQVYPLEERGGEVRVGLPRGSFTLFGWKLW